MFKFRKDHPSRPVNWRWEKAKIVADLGVDMPEHAALDKWIRVAAAFKKNMDKCSNEIDYYRLCLKYPILATALDLLDENNNTTGKPNSMRYEIEARLLARESFQDIANKAGTTSKVIEWFERLFFNVTDKLDNKMYIFHHVIGDVIQKGFTDKDFAVLWKLYAYVRGPVMLDFLISTFSDWSHVSIDGIESAISQDRRTTMQRKSMFATRMMGVNSYTTDRLIELQTKIIEIEKAAGISNAADSVQNNIQVMLNNLPFLVGPNPEAGNLVSDFTKKYRELPVELKTEEIMRVASGETLNTEELTEFKFPEPVKDANKIIEAS